MFGLRLRAVGDKPAAAQALSVSVLRVRFWAVLLSGLLTAVGGVYLVFEQRQFVALMSAAWLSCAGCDDFWRLASRCGVRQRRCCSATAKPRESSCKRGLLIPNWLLNACPTSSPCFR